MGVEGALTFFPVGILRLRIFRLAACSAGVDELDPMGDQAC